MSTAEILGGQIWVVALGLSIGLISLLLLSRRISAYMRQKRLAKLQDDDDVRDIDSAHANFNKMRLQFFIVLGLLMVIILLAAVLN